MRYSVTVPNFGDFADPRAFVEFARTAEEAGWDGVFVWDHVVEQKDLRRPIADPWVLLAAAAMVTERVRLGTLITPVARRRPGKLAREVATLDRLSGGRVVLGVGLGAPIEDEYGTFGDTTDPRVLAGRLDEGLDVVNALWSGERVDHVGEHFTARDVTFLPTPVQRPRVPVWVGGQWSKWGPLRRAARWDGSVPLFTGGFEALPPPVAEVREWRRRIQELRGDVDAPFEYVVGGATDPRRAADVIGPLAEAGATWWDERMPMDDAVGEVGPILRRVAAGSPAG